MRKTLLFQWRIGAEDLPQWSVLHLFASKRIVFQISVRLLADHFILLPAEIYRFLASTYYDELIGLCHALDIRLETIFL